MKHVYTKTQLQEALNQGEQEITLHGEVADAVAHKYRAKKNAKTGGLMLAVGGILALPFTGGLSLSAVAAGLTIGSVTISAAELAILVGGTVALAGIIKDYDIEMYPDGHVVLKKK